MPGRILSGSWDILKHLQRRAQEEKCEFLIHAGDFCHGPSLTPDYVRAYNDFCIPSYHSLGNHDSDQTPLAETLAAYNMPAEYYFFDCGGYRFVVTDTNYYCYEGQYIHYDMSNYYPYGPYRDFMPPEELEWLEETIASAPHPCVLINHASFEREADGVKNGAEVRRIINDANACRPHSVLLCINGHYHRDNIRILDGVCYWDTNAVSYDWVEKTHDCYPEELTKDYSMLNHTVVYNDPLYAIVTLEGTTIDISGVDSSMLLGVTREMTGNKKFDLSGRPVVPKVQSARITLG